MNTLNVENEKGRPFLKPWSLFFCLLFLALDLKAQSPTENFLRIQDLRDGERTSTLITTPGTVTRQGRRVRSTARAVAPTSQMARKAAIRTAYSQMARSEISTRKEFSQLAAKLTMAMGELKRAQTQILSEKKTREGYIVEAETVQDAVQLARDFRETACSNFRLVALLPEYVDGVKVPSFRVETALTGALIQQRFQVYDWNFVTQDKPVEALLRATISGDNTSAVQVGSRLLANILLIGKVETVYSQNNEGIISYIASVNLRAVQTDTGRVLFAKEFSAKGFGQDKAQAVRNVIASLGKVVAEETPAQLLERMEEMPLIIQLVTKKPGQTAELENLLKSLPGIRDVQRKETANGVLFRIRSREKPAAIGAWIEQKSSYRVLDYER